MLRSVEPAVPVLLARTHSRLLRWADPAGASLEGDLAASWEQQEGSAVVLRLNASAHWHDREPLAGRGVTAEDVASHFSRLLTLRDSGGLTPSLALHFASLEAATALPGETVRLDLSRPDALFLPALASGLALIAAPEAVDAFEGSWDQLEPASVVGSGPFVLDALEPGATFSAHATGHAVPRLQSLVMGQPNASGAAARQRFVDRLIDQFVARDRRDAEAIDSGMPSVVRFERFEEAPTISTFFAGAPPWDNPLLLRALSAAAHRLVLADRLHGGRAAASGPVGPSRTAFALPEAELADLPGYGSDSAAAAAEARSLWQAGGGPALGPVTFDIPAIYDPLYSASSVFIGILNEVLGPGTARAEVHSYPVISARALGLEYGNGSARSWFGWAPPVDDPDPTRELYNTFRSEAPGWAPFAVRDERLDQLLDAAIAEFNIEMRADLVHQASRRLLELGGAGVIPWLLQWSTVYRQRYLGGAAPSSFSGLERDSELWVDTSDPEFPAGR